MILFIIPAEDREYLNSHFAEQAVTSRIPASNQMMSGSGELIVEVVEQVGNAAIWGALATVLVSYIKNKSRRRVSVKTRDGSSIELEGLSVKEIEKVLEMAESVNIKKKIKK